MSYSESQFQQVYADFQPKILRHVARLVGEQEAEDLTQEIFVKVHQALDNFRGESKLSTWLYRIATNAAIDRLRCPSFQRAAQQRSLDDSMESGEAEVDDRGVWTEEKATSAEQQFVRNEMNECILGFIKKLPENYRTVLVLSEFEGLRNNEIAETLGVTLDTVKIRLHRARERLKEELVAKCDPSWVEENEFVPDMRNFERQIRGVSFPDALRL
jgi:RNA polymerase sigma-70 factor (ECF subfamily)